MRENYKAGHGRAWMEYVAGINTTWTNACATLFVLLFVVWVGPANALPQADEPVSYAGHGILYAFDGSAVVPTPAFIGDAQRYYLDRVRAQATAAQRAQLDAKVAELDALNLDAKSRLYAHYRLLKWSMAQFAPPSAATLTDRNELLRSYILASDVPISASTDAIGQPVFAPSASLSASLAAVGMAEPAVLFSTTLGGSDYKAECEANGVPSPPKWGTSAWDSIGNLDREFISKGSVAKVYAYESAAPDGVCIALPRVSGSTIQLLGVICLGRTTSKACFWDNQVGGATVSFPEGQQKDIPGPSFSGGIDLTAPGAGRCTSCHAGENPYILHPGTSLSAPAIGMDLFSVDWYDPLVNPTWAQNAGPSSLIDALDTSGDCIGCHTDGGSGGRFPDLSTAVLGYCNDVLRKAVGNCTTPGGCSSDGMTVDPTMPLGSPGSSATAAHVMALINACSNAPNPILRIDETTLDYGEVERGFSFRKALVIHNDGNATLEVTVVQGPNPADFADSAQWSQTSLQTATEFIAPGDPPLILTQTYTPQDTNTHNIYLQVNSNDSASPTERITLTGSGKDPTPIDSVLVLDRSGSMNDSAGDRRKIEAMRDAANLYADLLRDNPPGDSTGDKLGFVKYNHNNSDYMNLGFMDAAKDTEIAGKLSNTALGASADLRPEGDTGIGGAMQLAASILLPSPASRKQVMIVMTDGRENEDPRINEVIDPIQDANDDLMMFSIGLGQDIEPDKLQNITNVTNGFHQVAGSLTDVNVFDLETFYFKIFAAAADMELVVDPTHSETLLSPDPVIVDSATIISSDHSATFLVLDDPVLRTFYDLEFLTPDGTVIVPGVTIGGIGIQESSRHTYKIFRVVFPDVSQAHLYTGEWKLRLKPNGLWDERAVKLALAESDIDYSGWISPFAGNVPIGFAGAVSSDYRLAVEVLPSSFLPGATIRLTATLTDRQWPAPDGSVTVTVTNPGGSTSLVTLHDDGSHGDTQGGDAVWTNSFTQTATQGVYKFLFRSIGSNERGEMAPREASRYVTLQYERPVTSDDDECIPCAWLRWLLLLGLVLLLWIWYCTCWRRG